MTNYDYNLQESFLNHVAGDKVSAEQLQRLVKLGYLNESLKLTDEGEAEVALLRNGYCTVMMGVFGPHTVCRKL